MLHEVICAHQMIATTGYAGIATTLWTGVTAPFGDPRISIASLLFHRERAMPRPRLPVRPLICDNDLQLASLA